MSAPEADPAPAAATAEPICELHAWPTQGIRSIYSGWFHGGIVDGAVKGRDGYKELPERVLPPEVQVSEMRKMDLAGILNLPGYSVTVHANPLPSRVARSTKGRILRRATPCYAELVVDDVFFQEDLIDGRFLKAILRFRRFDAGAEPIDKFGSYIQRRVKLFPPKEPGQVKAAFDEFTTEFSGAIAEFGRALSNRKTD
ncbi:hypothetical protein GCM10023115_11180 [Pontixanthobacter gangjinensis]|uniref:Uncharacterized protein n=1 Tax=Pontixanthobacter gangjinensis TaxID=1028742 RepID=A0A6I4SL22_9SPHN|nr:hypothetical protein [Pontixanthobacter gangjinensis]MXO56364.1 hypothetical protein [Pontixanthobacter gangjinensis]